MHIDLARGTQVGVAVRDLEPVVELYSEGLGLGPFEIEEIETRDAVYCAAAGERPAPARLRVASAPLGRCEMELIEVVAGRPYHADCLDSEGEGMNHFNLDKGTAEAYLDTLSKLYWRGIEPFWGLPFGSFCYVESAGIGGVTFEVMVGSGHAGKKGQHHLGLVVEDTQRTIDFYEKRIGLGPFRTGEYPMPRAFYREARIDTTFRASFCDLGECRLQLFQTLEGDTPLSDSIAGRGEGMQHLCLNVADLDAALAELALDGIEPLWRAPDQRVAQLDTRSIGGMTFALAEAG